MEGARFLALLLYFEGRVEGRVAIAPLKREALPSLAAYARAGTGDPHLTVRGSHFMGLIVGGKAPLP